MYNVVIYEQKAKNIIFFKLLTQLVIFISWVKISDRKLCRYAPNVHIPGTPKQMYIIYTVLIT